MRVLIIDDHALMAQGLSHYFSNIEEIKVVGHIADPEGALDEIARTSPEVVTLDLSMPGVHGIDMIGKIKNLAPKCRIIVLTGLTDQVVLKEVYQKQPHAMIQKQGDPEHLLNAINSPAGSSPYLCSRMKDILSACELSNTDECIVSLSRREREIVGLLADGLTTKEAADQLFVSEHTIRKHRENMMRKINAKSSAQLIAYAVQRGFI